LLFGKVFRGITESYNYSELGGQIHSGKITSDLMKPLNLSSIRLFRTIGERFVHNSINTTTYILASILAFSTFAKFQPVVLNNLLVLILLIPVAFYIWFVAGEIMGMLAFFLEDSRVYSRTVQSYNAFLGIMVSNFIPLDKLPFKEFWMATPFAFTVHHPMQIYLGKYDTNVTLSLPFQEDLGIQVPQILLVFLGGIAWCLVLYFLAKFVFKAGLKRNEAVGL
jgi:ABC-type uncharacterized transport system permease subunit